MDNIITLRKNYKQIERDSDFERSSQHEKVHIHLPYSYNIFAIFPA